MFNGVIVGGEDQETETTTSATADYEATTEYDYEYVYDEEGAIALDEEVSHLFMSLPLEIR